ncbi:MAG: MFS transporter [Firmicutes bacterium]|nr:MFS transporter [Bacillota bacterium]
MKKMSKDQLLVLIGACMVQSAIIGIILNSSGVFFAQMRVELGLSMTKIASHNTIRAITGALSGAYLTKLFFRTNKKMYLRVAVLSVAVGFFLLTLGAKGIMWYIASGMIGLFISISMISISYVLSHWFPGNAGLMTGVASAFSGIGGALFSPVAGKLIGAVGFLKAMGVFSVITLIVGFTGVELMLPKKGEALFAEDDRPKAGVQPGAKAGDLYIPHLALRFALTALTLTGSSIMLQFIFNVSVFAQTVGYTLDTAALLSSMVMIGNISGKIIFGYIADRLSVWKAVITLAAAIMCSILCFIFFYDRIAILYVASLVYGFGYAIGSVGLSRCCVSAYGMQGQKTMSGYHVSISNAFGALVSLGIGMIYDLVGSYSPILWIGFVSGAVMIISSISIERIIKADGELA